jgi:hypothetical protein
MTRTRLMVLTTALLCFSAGPVTADETTTRIGAGLLVTGLADNLSGRGESTISSLSDRPDNVTRITPIVLFDIRRTKDRDTFFFGTPLDEQAAISLGYRRSLDAGAVTGSIFYSLFGKEWRNPYLVGTPRRDTTAYNFGGRLVFEEISGTPLSAEFKTTVKKIEHEELSGNLRRNGVLVEAGLSWKESLGSGWTLTPSASYRRGQYEGAASSFNGGTVGAALSWKNATMMVSGKAAGLINAYDAHNPLFNKARNDLGYRLQGMVTWTDPFGWQSVYTTIGYIHGDTRSNIDFYEVSSHTGYAVAGYRF